MRTIAVPFARIFAGDYRLAAGFYVSADQSAVDLMRDFPEADPLGELCKPQGLYRGPMFRRIFAPDAAFGRPYVTATDLEQAEVRPAVYLSRRHGRLLNLLALNTDHIVVSRSGVNLGKAFYIRPDMDGFVGSDDLIRVDVDPERVRPGYLFAFLDSRFGRSGLRQPTHGGSVRHIEPNDLADLRVPRLADHMEEAIHLRVFRASRLLAGHVEGLEGATRRLERATGLLPELVATWENDPSHLGWTEASPAEGSLRALNHDPRAARVRSVLTGQTHSCLGELCDPDYFRGKQVFKREEASPQDGVLLLGQRAAFRLRPEGRYISSRSVEANRLRVPAGTVLIPSHGTLGPRELYCRAIAVTPGMSEYAFSGDFFRCVPRADRVAPGYLYAFLRSRHAFRLLRALSSGGKQQELAPSRMAALPVPRLAASEEAAIAAQVDAALREFDEAVGELTGARQDLEQALARPRGR